MSDQDFYTYDQHPVFRDFVNKELGGNVPQQFVSSCCCIPPNCPTGLWGAPAGSGSSSNRWSLSVSDEILDCPSRPPPCPPPTKPEEAGPEITIDPLVLDLDGDGISILSQENGVFFDFDANGFNELNGWIGAGSGLLMLDLNGNGELDDGSELFGDFTMMPTGENAGNGFHALSQYDDNQDGRIDANESVILILRCTINLYTLYSLPSTRLPLLPVRLSSQCINVRENTFASPMILFQREN